MPSQFIIEDGIISWFDGPEWNDVAFDSMKEQEGDLEAWAKANAIWEDDTGAARAGLTAKATEAGGVVTLAIAHTVPHGYWLEVIQSGRFAILTRAIEENAAKIMANVTSAVRSARKGRNL